VGRFMSTGLIVKLSDAPRDLQRNIRAFWPKSEWENAANIAYLESGWDANATNDTTSQDTPCGTVIAQRNGVEITAEYSLGYFQINSCNFPTWDAQSLLDPYQNCGTAHMIWDQQGWAAWYFSAQALGIL